MSKVRSSFYFSDGEIVEQYLYNLCKCSFFPFLLYLESLEVRIMRRDLDRSSSSTSKEIKKSSCLRAPLFDEEMFVYAFLFSEREKECESSFFVSCREGEDLKTG